MTMSKHAMNRMMQRNRSVVHMTPKQIMALAESVEPSTSASGALKYALPGLNLVLVVNPVNGVVMTAYKENEDA